jgi:hypothetical protein
MIALYNCILIPVSVCIFILIIDTSQVELLLDTTLVTPSLQAAKGSRATTVGRRFSSHVIKNIGKEPVTQLAH